MKGCKYIKGLIDEAERPELLSFEVNDHISRCGDCESFANDRAQLRRLLASGTRVTAPVNFDAMLSVRLGETRARGAFSWLSPAGYLRLGAATAGLVIMIFAAQQVGLFSGQSSREAKSATEVSAKAPEVQPLPGSASQPRAEAAPDHGEITTPGGRELGRLGSTVLRSSRNLRGAVVLSREAAPAGYSTADEGGVVLLRGPNGSMDVPMPTVSVGAQPLLYVSAGQRPVRSSVGTSF